MDIIAIEKDLIARAWMESQGYANIAALCDFGSRFAGTESEAQARDFIAAKFREYGLANVHLDPFEYLGWRRGSCRLAAVSPRAATFGDAISLVYSPNTPEGGLQGRLVDVGMGTEKEYGARAGQLAGSIVLCSSANPEEGRAPHRREKYGRAVEGGAVGFIYSRHLPGGLPETGSLRPGRLGEIPAVAVSYETGFALKRLIEGAGGAGAVARMEVQNSSAPAVANHVVADVPGGAGAAAGAGVMIVVGAHYDGHDISQGARDDATGTALVLELARLFAPLGGRLRRTIRFIAFACEELGVLGSTEYVKKHPDEMPATALMINLDSAVGHGKLGFECGGMEEVAAELKAIAEETGYPLYLREGMGPMGTASDHFPFFIAGVPAITMLARDENRAEGRGFGHTAMDTLDKVDRRDIMECAMVAGRVLLRLASAAGPIGLHRTADEIKALLIGQELEAPLRAQGKWPYA